MKAKFLDLNEVITGTYDQTKTTIQGRYYQKTINSQLVLGPPLTQFIDVVTDTTAGGAVTPSGVFRLSPILTGNIARLFILGSEAAGVTPLLLYNFDITTGSKTYVGRINFQTADVAATTTTFRSLNVEDNGTSGWKIFVVTTGSVLINGGPYLLNNIALSDFVQVGFPTINFATGNDQKAVYFLQDPAFVGSAHLNTASAGSVVDRANDKLYIHNGVAATHQYYVFDYSVAPTYSTRSVTGTAATDIISDAGHPFVNGDPVVFTALTGGTGLVVGTTYFIVTSVAGVSYQLSATSGGAAINFTTDITSATLGRAFGTNTNLFMHKTGNLPALTGTLLLTNSENFSTPQHGSNSGFDCAAFGTTTNLYIGKLSELTVGAVTWPSLSSSNVLGATNEVTTPTPAFISWDNSIDRFAYITNTSIFYFKQLVNNVIDLVAGFLNTVYYEGTTPQVVDFGAVTILGINANHGWQMFLGGTTGQRGIFAQDIKSNSFFDYSYVVSKVIDNQNNTVIQHGTLEQLFDFTSPMEFFYRTSGFGSITGGWTSFEIAETINVPPSSQIQYKIATNAPGDAGTNGSQINELTVVYENNLESSDHWQISKDLSSTGGTHKVVAYLAQAFTSSVPTIYARATQQGTTTSVGSANTSANPTQFRYSTNGGTSWNNLGTIPNVVGTLLEWTISPTPTVDYLPSIKES